MHKTTGKLFLPYARQAGHCPPTPLWGYPEPAVRCIVSAAVFIVAGGMYVSVTLVTPLFFELRARTNTSRLPVRLNRSHLKPIAMPSSSREEVFFIYFQKVTVTLSDFSLLLYLRNSLWWLKLQIKRTIYRQRTDWNIGNSTFSTHSTNDDEEKVVQEVELCMKCGSVLFFFF